MYVTVVIHYPDDTTEVIEIPDKKFTGSTLRVLGKSKGRKPKMIVAPSRGRQTGKVAGFSPQF
jgi:hypothetical protein